MTCAVVGFWCGGSSAWPSAFPAMAPSSTVAPVLRAWSKGDLSRPTKVEFGQKEWPRRNRHIRRRDTSEQQPYRRDKCIWRGRGSWWNCSRSRGPRTASGKRKPCMSGRIYSVCVPPTPGGRRRRGPRGPRSPTWSTRRPCMWRMRGWLRMPAKREREREADW